MILSDDQVLIQDSIRSYAQAEIRPRSMEFEEKGGYPPELFEQLGEMGLMGMTAPEEFGGAGADMVSYTLAMIELAAADGPISTIVSIQNSLIVGAILKDGTEAQKSGWLPELVSGRTIGAFCLTEPEAGSDASAIRTRATKTEKGWRIDGEKQFISSGKIAGLAMIVAVTNPENPRKGMTVFLVPTDTPGYEVARVEKKLGQHASETCALRFEGLEVGDDAVLGEVGRGYGVALSNLETGRIGIAAQCVGMARAAMDIAVDYAKERKSFGAPLIEHQAVGHRLADMAAKLEAAKQLVLHAAALKDAGLPCLCEASMAKLVASELAESICSAAIQTLGGYGYIEDYGLAKIARDVRVGQIYEGASDIQRMLIARSL